MLKHLLIVGAGGALGAIMRYLNTKLFAQYFDTSLHWATLITNVVGCFLMGIAYVYLINKMDASESMRLFIMTGFLGALTTWSTFSMESVLLVINGEYLKGFSYLFLTMVLCTLAFFIAVKITPY